MERESNRHLRSESYQKKQLLEKIELSLHQKEAFINLPTPFQLLVMDTTQEVLLLTPEELAKKRRLLDEDKNGYLVAKKVAEGRLTGINTGIQRYLDEQQIFTSQKNSAIAERISRMMVAERMLGKGIAEQMGWTRNEGFGLYIPQAKQAFALCKEFMQTLA